MSGVEILGVIASAGQIAEFGLVFIALISSTYERIKDAPGTIEQHVKQIEELIGVTEHIQQTARHRHPTVYTYIKSIHLEAKELSAVLDQILRRYNKHSIKTYWEILKGREQKRIDIIFDNLEKTKSALTLCIVGCNADSLHGIQASIKNIEKAMTQPTGLSEQAQNQLDISEEDSDSQIGGGEFSLCSPSSSYQDADATLIRVPSRELIPAFAFDTEALDRGSSHQPWQQTESSTFPTAPRNDRGPVEIAGSVHFMRNVKLGRKAEFINGDKFNGFAEPIVPAGNGVRRLAEDLDIKAKASAINGSVVNSLSWMSRLVRRRMGNKRNTGE